MAHFYKTILCFVIALLATTNSFSQTIITIGNGTSVNSNTVYPAPYGNWYFGAKHQMLILASELTAAGATVGNINSLAFNVSVIQGTALQGFTIRLASTSQTSLASFYTGTFTTVYGPQTYTETTGWNTHTFSTPFYWDGSSGIIVETCFNNGNYTNNAEMFYTTTSFNSTLYYRADASTVCSNTGGTVSTNRPNMKFNFQPTTVPPVAAFNADKTFTCDGLVNFADSSCCGVTSWLWDFGDGATSTSANPSHTYTAAGTYSVQLKVTNPYGNNTLQKSNYITVSSGGGPVAASCAPATISNCCGFGITNVTFNTLNSTTPDASEGYVDLSCAQATTVYAGADYSISVSTPQPAAHNVRVWIDYNNDGSFDDITELAFSADNSTLATGTISIPASAVTNTPLRMRVSADYDGFGAPTPCGDLTYGQAEDYSVTVLTNNSAPIAEFSSDITTSCNGLVQFNDLSQNLPDNWFWDFGDGDTSMVANPSHTYIASGVYSVSLIASNANGSDTITKTNYITINIGGSPVAASCTPVTVSYCCGYGIYRVRFAGIDNSTDPGSEGYKDYSCSDNTQVTQGNIYQLSIQTSVVDSQDTKVWIDWDNNGSFSNTTELVMTSLNHSNPNGYISVPGNTVLNTPLRMRISSDYSGSNPGACSNSIYGQVEDYGVTVIQNVNPPEVFFRAAPLSSCDGIISFIDSTRNAPTSWLWYFGDGTTSTNQNPTHTYTATGVYTIKLVAYNAFGADSLTKTSYVNIVSTSGGPVAASCIQNTIANCCGMGIYNVTLNTINNTTPDGAEGYQDFGCLQQTSLISGQSYSISVKTGTTYSENVSVWIDYNNDGTFNNTNEKVFSQYALQNHSGTINVSSSAVLNAPLRMRVTSDYNTINDACTDVQYGQAEDYTVVITPNTVPPVAAFSAGSTSSCNGIIMFNGISANATSYLWSFGDGTTSTQQNPTHTYSSPGVYSVNLKVCNAFGCDSLLKPNYITINSGGPVSASCAPVTTGYCCGMGIYNVTFNTINNTTSDGLDSYKDYSCSHMTSVTAGQNYSFSVRTGTTYSENVVVWIDYDNNGVFNNTNEKVYTDYALQNHSATINISATAVLNAPLRVRVASDYNIITDACTDVTYGQVEDYTVTILPNTVPPVVSFSAVSTSSCNGVITFNNTTTNATSYLWNFGDGTTSASQSPTHTYSAAGVYSVQLKACNAYGCDSLLQTNYITINSGGPANASCAPVTTSYCCGMGIYNVTFNTINNTTNDGSDSYKDYSCSHMTTVTAAQNYTISVRTGTTYSENVVVWIDYDNNGVFNNTNEKVYSDYVLQNHNGTITISSAAVLNTPLRVRIASDYGTIADACTDVTYGQVEDYTVTILPNTNPPVVGFNSASTSTCNGIVVFNNTTTNATSFVWNFGDGTSSSQQYPVHTYTSPGTYSISLKACNAYGCDSLLLTNYISVTTGGPVTATCAPATSGYCCGIGVYNVTFNTINNTSSDGADGYMDYSCTNSTTVLAGQSYSLSVTTGTSYPENVAVWIDYDNDGDFNNTTERVYDDNATQVHTASITISSSAQLNTALRMRVASDYNTIVDACTDVMYGQVEDYSITIQPNTAPPVVDFSADNTSPCNGIVDFTNTTTNAVTFTWYFGDGTTSSQYSPSHTYSNAGTYNVALYACNQYGCDSVMLSNYITVNTNGPVNISCSPITTAYCCGMGISNVTLNSINNTTADGTDSYQDYSCAISTSLTAATPYALTVKTGTTYSENVYVWIDYNNDGSLSSAELVYSDYALTTHSGTITVPATAVYNTALRMRVSSDYSAIAGACDDVQYGQVEDYSVIILPNINPPAIGFTANTTISCSGTFDFDNTSSNATTYTWSFGDGNYSNQANPSHTYSAQGTYTVSLIGCNSFGCDTLTMTNYLTYNSNGPVAASCYPATTSYCCGIGIYNVTLNAINNSTSDGADGYMDYSCASQTSLIQGLSYNLSVTTGTGYPENVVVWIDYNNDGTFNNTTEKVYSNNSTQIHNGSITIPTTAVLNTPLRMRVASDYNTISGACTSVTYGQVEDYAVTITANTTPPDISFSATMATNCSGLVTFTNTTINGTSYFWNFGDGTTSTQQTPSHTYTSSGTYTVYLKSCNANGCDSLIKTNYVVINTSGPVAASCSPTTLSYCCGIGVVNFTLNTIDNTTADGADDYKDYSCNYQTTLITGSTNNISVTTGSAYNEYVKVWIDYNNDGLFNTTNELAYYHHGLQYHNGTVAVPTNAVLNVPLRLRVASDYDTIITACSNVTYGQVEDYSVIITTSVGAFVANYPANINHVNLTPNPANESLNIKADFRSSSHFSLVVTDMVGKVLVRNSYSEIQNFESDLDVSSYPAGIYFVKLSVDGQSYTTKFCVQH